jgi:hypothetical protein
VLSREDLAAEWIAKIGLHIGHRDITRHIQEIEARLAKVSADAWRARQSEMVEVENQGYRLSASQQQFVARVLAYGTTSEFGRELMKHEVRHSAVLQNWIAYHAHPMD